MSRPIQLRYDDINNGETVIGTYLTEDHLIEQAQLKNSGSGEYTRLVIKGDNQLKDRLPTDYTQYATSEPEILVYSLSDSGNWVLRDRVFAEDKGILQDDGSYRNNQLWGFQKWVGRQKTGTTVNETSSTITTIVDKLLPSGYVAETPSDDTVPTLDNYSFQGKIDRGIRDLVRDYPVKIWFTAETDGSGNYKVKVQSKGYGDVVQTVTFDSERQTEGYQIIRFEEEDKSNLVNKVEVQGVDSNGKKITSEVEDSTSINEHGERYVHRNVGYLESQAQADNIANDILNPQPSPHAKMAIPFQDQNILNASVDILDNRYGINAVYTVVKQQDFFTEGRTEVELGFEKNRSEERRDRDRELDERNHQLFPAESTDVGNQNLNVGDAEAQTSTSGENNTAEAQTSTSGENNTAEAQTTSSSSATEEALGFPGLDQAGNGSVSFGNSLSQVAQVGFSGNPEAFRIYEASIFFNSTEHVRVRIEQGGAAVYDVWHYTGSNQKVLVQAPYYPDSSIADTTARLKVESESGSNSTTGSGAFSIRYEQPHDHIITTTTTDSGHGSPSDPSEHIWTGSTIDSGHGAPDDPSEHIWTGNTVDSGHGSDATNPHGGDTDAKNIEVAQEQKTDR